MQDRDCPWRFIAGELGAGGSDQGWGGEGRRLGLQIFAGAGRIPGIAQSMAEVWPGGAALLVRDQYLADIFRKLFSTLVDLKKFEVLDLRSFLALPMDWCRGRAILADDLLDLLLETSRESGLEGQLLNRLYLAGQLVGVSQSLLLPGASVNFFSPGSGEAVLVDDNRVIPPFRGLFHRVFKGGKAPAPFSWNLMEEGSGEGEFPLGQLSDLMARGGGDLLMLWKDQEMATRRCLDMEAWASTLGYSSVLAWQGADKESGKVAPFRLVHSHCRTPVPLVRKGRGYRPLAALVLGYPPSPPPFLMEDQSHHGTGGRSRVNSLRALMVRHQILSALRINSATKIFVRGWIARNRREFIRETGLKELEISANP